MTVTEEELQRIVAAAVKIALKEIKGIEEQPTNPPAEKITVNKFGKEELEDAMRIMQANRGKGDEPMVGIFWITYMPTPALNLAVYLALRCMRMYGKKSITANVTRTGTSVLMWVPTR